jgi:cell division protease FtsH
MITQYGMSERLGLVTFEGPREGAFLDVPGARQRVTYSEQTAQLIDEEIQKLMTEAHGRVVRTLTERRATLDALAQLLLKQEVVERSMLETLLKDPTATAPAALAPVVPKAAASSVGDRHHD